MSVAEESGEVLARPYTVGTFQTRLNAFQDFIKDITFQDVEATPEERRQMITGIKHVIIIIYDVIHQGIIMRIHTRKQLSPR